MRPFLIAGNWKMNKTAAETRLFFEQIKGLMEPKLTSELLICPPFTALSEAFHLNHGQIALGAQNVYPKSSGAYTGEIAPAMLAEWVSYVLVGHSERRTLLHESDAFINEKLHALLQAHLKPILCVGESLEERKQNRTFEVIATALKAGLKDVSSSAMSQVTIAYEPIWAIGTGETATPEIAQAVHRFIRNWLQENFDQTTATKVRILYGGSLKSSNAKALLSQPDIDGGLIGGASLKPEEFIAIARIADTISK